MKCLYTNCEPMQLTIMLSTRFVGNCDTPHLGDFKCRFYLGTLQPLIFDHCSQHNRHAIFIHPFLTPATETEAILFLHFINSFASFNDVGYARTRVGESLNELSLFPRFTPPSPPPPPTPPPPSPVFSTSYYWVSIKSLQLMGEPGLYGKRLRRGETDHKQRAWHRLPTEPLCAELKDRKRLRAQPETSRRTFAEVR